MSKPFFRQNDKNCTPMNVYIIDNIMPKVKGNSWKILCLIFRETGGNHSAIAEISFNQIRIKTGISSSSTVNKALKYLINENYITGIHRTIDPHKAAALLQDKTPQYIAGGVVCEWCQGETLRLHSHHFPVSAKDNGEETVEICPNCHDEYHCLMDQKSYMLGKGLLNE